MRKRHITDLQERARLQARIREQREESKKHDQRMAELCAQGGITLEKFRSMSMLQQERFFAGLEQHNKEKP